MSSFIKWIQTFNRLNFSFSFFRKRRQEPSLWRRSTTSWISWKREASQSKYQQILVISPGSIQPQIRVRMVPAQLFGIQHGRKGKKMKEEKNCKFCFVFQSVVWYLCRRNYNFFYEQVFLKTFFLKFFRILIYQIFKV